MFIKLYVSNIKIKGHKNNTLNLPLFLQDWIKVYTKLNILKENKNLKPCKKKFL